MTLSFTPDSIRALDLAIAEARIRYAAEHLNFHQIFGNDTVPGIQRVLRREDTHTRSGRNRVAVVERLLRAQRRTPHTLWTLLLVQAFAPLLTRRNRRLGGSPEVTARVVQTFFDALEYIPESLRPSELVPYLVSRSRRGLFGGKRVFAQTIPAAPESGVRLCGSTTAKAVTP